MLSEVPRYPLGITKGAQYEQKILQPICSCLTAGDDARAREAERTPTGGGRGMPPYSGRYNATRSAWPKSVVVRISCPAT